MTPETDLVTVTIGGNDIDIGGLWLSCAQLGTSDPSGKPCTRQATAGGTDLYAQRIAATAPKVARVLDGIRQRSPRAAVLLVGYLRILPPAGGCPAFPSPMLTCLTWTVLSSGSRLCWPARPAATAPVFVDPYTNSLGHDACQPPGMKWVEGTIPASPAAVVHPNATGMEAVAGFALDTLRTLTAPHN